MSCRFTYSLISKKNTSLLLEGVHLQYQLNRGTHFPLMTCLWGFKSCQRSQSLLGILNKMHYCTLPSPRSLKRNCSVWSPHSISLKSLWCQPIETWPHNSFGCSLYPSSPASILQVGLNKRVPACIQGHVHHINAFMRHTPSSHLLHPISACAFSLIEFILQIYEILYIIYYIKDNKRHHSYFNEALCSLFKLITTCTFSCTLFV